MPDYPYIPGAEIAEEVMRADGGLRWTYRKYDKGFWDLNFVDIKTAAKGTLESLRKSDFDCLFIDDVNDSGGTHTVRFAGPWAPRETIDGIWTVPVRLEEV